MLALQKIFIYCIAQNFVVSVLQHDFCISLIIRAETTNLQIAIETTNSYRNNKFTIIFYKREFSSYSKIKKIVLQMHVH